jgi:hypothetical protein
MNDGNRSLDLDELLHPAQAFDHPNQVVADPDLTLNEKRAILASWASDACAVEAAHEFRANSRGALVKFDDIIDALRSLDAENSQAKYKKAVRRRKIFTRVFGANDNGSGQSLQ